MSPDWPVLTLRVAADADPGALARVLERFQNLNLTPRRVIAEWGINHMLHVRLDIAGLSEDRVSLIAAKLGQVPSILTVYWHR
jgi:hypothetical protein